MSGRSLVDKLVHGVAFLVVRFGVQIVAGLGAAIILLRYLGPTRYGLFVLAAGIAGMLGIVGGNFEECVRRYVPEYLGRGAGGAARKSFALSLFARMALSLVAAAIVFLSADTVSALYAIPELAPLLRIGCLLVPAFGLEHIGTHAFIGVQRHDLATMSALGLGVLQLLVAAATAIVGLSLEEFFALNVLAWLAWGVFATAWAWRIVGRAARDAGSQPDEPTTRELARQLASYVWPLWGAAANFTLYQHASKLILGYCAPVEIVGFFNVGKSILERFTALYQQIPNALLPALSEQRGAAGQRVVDEAVEGLGPWVGAISALLSATVFLFAPELVALLAGDAYGAAVPLTRILALQFLFRLPSNLWGTLYYVRERTLDLLWVNVARVIPMVLLLMLVVVDYEARGAAVIEALSYTIAVGIFVWHMPRGLGVSGRPLALVVIRSALAAAIVCALGTALSLVGLPLAASIAVRVALIALGLPPLLVVLRLLGRREVAALSRHEMSDPLLERVRRVVLVYLRAAARIGGVAVS